jgi:hypothetical protein
MATAPFRFRPYSQKLLPGKWLALAKDLEGFLKIGSDPLIVDKLNRWAFIPASPCEERSDAAI